MFSISYPSGMIYKGGVEQTDMAEWTAFLAGGGTPEALQDAPVHRRIEISAWQIRKALNALALRDGVEVAVAASSNPDVRDGWVHGTVFWSDHPFALMIGAILSKSAGEVYAIFQFGETL